MPIPMHAIQTLLLVLLALRPATMAAAAPPEQARLDAIAEDARQSGDLPGLTVAVLDRSGAVSVGSAGVRSRGGEAPFARTDRVHLGSCTKAVTATLAAILIREGMREEDRRPRLRWETTVGEIFGEEADAAWRETTLADLLAHLGGAPARPEDALWRRAWVCSDPPEACRAAFVRDLLAQPPAAERGSFAYSNQGYAIAAVMIERVAGQPWETLVRRRIAEPLGMTTVGFGPPSRGGGDAPVGHDETGAVRDVDNPPVIAPGATMHCSMEDWARFIAVHLGNADSLARLGIDSKAIEEMHAARGTDGSYGLGWRVAERPWGGRVVMHAGSNTVWYCVAWVAPEKGFALLVATNQGGDRAVKACDQAAAAMVTLMSRPATP